MKIVKVLSMSLTSLVFMSGLAWGKVEHGHIVTTEGVFKAHYEKVGDYYLTEGDILVEPVRAPKKGEKSTFRRTGRWENNTVPYEIDPSIPNQFRLQTAIEYFANNTTVRLVPRTNEKDYVYFKNNGDADCSSFVGRKGGKQTINVPAWCGSGSLVHEVMHALGFYHEQSRPDRRKYIKIKWMNIQLKRWFNFFSSPFAKKTGAFDFDSIMLYPSYNSFAKDPNKPTMTTKSGETFDSQRSGLSEGDLEGLTAAYPARD